MNKYHFNLGIIILGLSLLSTACLQPSIRSAVASSSTQFTVKIKFFIEGYVSGQSAVMEPTLMNQGVGNDSTLVDHVEIVIHDAIAPFKALNIISADLKTDGTVSFSVPVQFLNGTYFLAVKHRSAIETWTSHPQVLVDGLNYDFSNSQSQAYGSNQMEVLKGVFAIYSGDVNQDGFIDKKDLELLMKDSFNFAFGNLATDLNADSAVDATDQQICENNARALVALKAPK